MKPKRKSKSKGITIAAAAALHAAAGEQRHCRPATLANRRNFAARVKRLWPNRALRTISRRHLKAMRETVSADFMKRLLQLLRWAWKQEMLPRDLTVNLFEPVLRDHATPVFLTPTEAQIVWAAVEPQWRVVFALAFFAGLRPFELLRLHWKSININERRIRIPAEVSKVRRARLIEEMPTILWTQLALAYEAAGRPTGPVIPNCRRDPRGRVGFGVFARQNFWARERQALARRSRVRLAQNVFRHTFASYFIAYTQSPGRAARIMGNSEEMLRKHYDGLVTKAEAKAYFHPTPVLALPRQAVQRAG